MLKRVKMSIKLKKKTKLRKKHSCHFIHSNQKIKTKCIDI